MSEKAEQFLRVFNRVYHQWFNVPGYNPPVEDDGPWTEEEMELTAEISDYCEQLFYEITEKQDEKDRDKNSTEPLTPPPAGQVRL